jgi:hypothetical protein
MKRVGLPFMTVVTVSEVIGSPDHVGTVVGVLL